MSFIDRARDYIQGIGTSTNVDPVKKIDIPDNLKNRSSISKENTRNLQNEGPKNINPGSVKSFLKFAGGSALILLGTTGFIVALPVTLPLAILGATIGLGIGLGVKLGIEKRDGETKQTIADAKEKVKDAEANLEKARINDVHIDDDFEVSLSNEDQANASLSATKNQLKEAREPMIERITEAGQYGAFAGASIGSIATLGLIALGVHLIHDSYL
jgi:hypothetical protein